MKRYTRYHPAGHMTGLGELRGVTKAAAVVVRFDGSVDAYGDVAVIDQAAERQDEQAKILLLRCADSYASEARKFSEMPRTGLPPDGALAEEECQHLRSRIPHRRG